MGPRDLAIAGAAALLAGFANALAGGGNLIGFPVLVGMGIPPVLATATTTLSLTPAYLAAGWGQRRDLDGQAHRLRRLLPAAAIGAAIGATLLVATPPHAFEMLIPVLLGVGVALLWIGPRLQRRIVSHEAGAVERLGPATVALFGASLYGGYFGAAAGVIILAALASVIVDSFTRLSAVKQLASAVVHAAASVVYIVAADIVWRDAAVMIVAATVGGLLGGRSASRVSPEVLRRVVIAAGVLATIVFAVRYYG